MNATVRQGSVIPGRMPLYGLLNTVFILYIGAAAAVAHAPNPRLLFLALLFAICSSPVLYQRRLNDRFAAYTIFFGIYFVSYGVLDVVGLTFGTTSPGSAPGFLSAPELVIVVGGLAFACGYVARARSERPSTFAVDDWPMSTLVIAGLIIWAAGTYATWLWQVRLTVHSGLFVNDNSELVTTLIMLGRYAQPMGLLVIAYAYMVSGSAVLTAVMVVLATYQVYLGFISDTKGGAMLGGILVIVTSVLVREKIPKLWALAGVLFILFAFPVFQAHRTIVVGDLGTTNAQAAENLGQDVERSIAGQKLTQAEHAQSFFQRSSVKSAVEMIVDRTGNGVAFQHGHTLIPLAFALIPRLVWQDKEGVETGRLVNTEFHVTGESSTYISPSHLGEMYWNFGWPGAVLGMWLVGCLIGWINTRCDLSTRTTVTRLLILAITILQLEVRFEASIANEYAMWLRSMVAILLLHRLFARASLTRDSTLPAYSSPTPVPPLSSVAATAAAAPSSNSPRFPNLLR